ncbi:hypothetical protein CK203_004275 [Vitis vinifera]|uniref:Retrotransposon gag domain-containing protein n=1 Tax=Vitis vinifera TaxID=29760 RepID=A0A438K9X0_VITVI|nr:hypothetical protein CK203_004275 [Vitis vinifera]
MMESESLGDFMQRFSLALIQIESYSTDAIMQAFKRSIISRTPFFESISKKSLYTMDDLFRRANKYSMLKNNHRAASQQIVAASRTIVSRSSIIPDPPKDFICKRAEKTKLKGHSKPNTGKIGRHLSLRSSSSITASCCPIIQNLDSFCWSNPVGGDASQRDHNCFCEYHKDKGHSTKECCHLHYLVERMVQADQLNKYIHS